MSVMEQETLRSSHCNLDGDYSTSGSRIEFSQGGRYMRVRFAPSPAMEWNNEQFWRPGGKRGVCKGFSRASRRTMLNRLNMVSTAASLPCFVTLTFPDDCFLDSVTEFAKWAKIRLDVWLKRLKRVAPDAAGFWRMEWQSRKSGQYEGKLVPHFHVMVWGLEERQFPAWDRFGREYEGVEAFVRSEDAQLTFSEVLDSFKGRVWGSEDQALKYNDRCVRNDCRRFEPREQFRWMSFKEWVAMSWYHVVDSGNEDHFLAGSSVERVRSWGGVMSYCSKYMAKLGDNNFLTEVPVGRSWGIFNRMDVPWGKMIELPLPEEIGVRVRRIFRRYLERVRGRSFSAPYGITFYGDVAQWSRLWASPPDTPF